MLNLDKIIRLVQHNCDISDACHADVFTVCGMALRFRDMFKWEKELLPWEEKESSEVLDWIGVKEDYWDQLTKHTYEPIPILEKHFDPFDTTGINAILEPFDLYYGAGYGQSLKPTFFLADILEDGKINDIHVSILGKELARDLLTAPALVQDNRIIIRKLVVHQFLWDQIMFIPKSGRFALAFALQRCGIERPQNASFHMEKVFSKIKDLFIYHELGEISDMAFQVDTWREIIGTYPHSPVELMARTVKDILADTSSNGTLNRIIQTRNKAALGFYSAFQTSMHRKLFPEMRTAFSLFLKDEAWGQIESAREIGNHKASHIACQMMEIFNTGKEREDMDWVQRKIQDTCLPV